MLNGASRRRETSGGWRQSAAPCTSFTPSTAPFQRFTGSDDFPRFPVFICSKSTGLMFPPVAVFDLSGSVQMVNKCWREQVEEGEQKSREAKIGTVFLIDRGETQPAFLPPVGDRQSCSWSSPMCLHRCGLCHSSVLTSRLRGTRGRHLPDQMRWVWWCWGQQLCRDSLQPSALTGVCVFRSSLPGYLIDSARLVMWAVINVWFSAGCVEFGPDVTSSERSIKVLLNSQDKVGSRQRWLQIRFMPS